MFPPYYSLLTPHSAIGATPNKKSPRQGRAGTLDLSSEIQTIKKASPFKVKLLIGLVKDHLTHLSVTTQRVSPELASGSCGLDETRTRDPLRDRQVF